MISETSEIMLHEILTENNLKTQVDIVLERGSGKTTLLGKLATKMIASGYTVAYFGDSFETFSKVAGINSSQDLWQRNSCS